MQRTVKMSLEGKTFRKWENGQNIYEFDKEIDPGVILIYSDGLCFQLKSRRGSGVGVYEVDMEKKLLGLKNMEKDALHREIIKLYR